MDLGEPQDQATITMEVGRDGEMRLHPVARTCGLARRLGTELTLYWILGYDGWVFLSFRDATRGHETFGGRNLLDTTKGADLGQAPDGRLILDFNLPITRPRLCGSMGLPSGTGREQAPGADPGRRAVLPGSRWTGLTEAISRDYTCPRMMQAAMLGRAQLA